MGAAVRDCARRRVTLVICARAGGENRTEKQNTIDDLDIEKW